MDYITINNATYAKNESKLIDSLFSTGGTCNGTFKKLKNGVKLFNLQGELFAYITNHTSKPWFVSASILDTGKTWYMQGLMTSAEEYLGLNKLTYNQAQDVADSVIAQLYN